MSQTYGNNQLGNEQVQVEISKGNYMDNVKKYKWPLIILLIIIIGGIIWYFCNKKKVAIDVEKTVVSPALLNGPNGASNANNISGANARQNRAVVNKVKMDGSQFN